MKANKQNMTNTHIYFKVKAYLKQQKLNLKINNTISRNIIIDVKLSQIQLLKTMKDYLCNHD